MNKKIYESSVLELFFDHPSSRFHLREVARQTGLHPNTVLRDARLLVREGLLLQTKTRAVNELQANRDAALFLVLKRLSNLRRILLSDVVDFLNEQYTAPEAIILFGSYCRGEDVEQSDVDIAIVTKRSLRLNVSLFEKQFKRNVQIIEVDLKRISKNLLTSLANGVVLKGYLTL